MAEATESLLKPTLHVEVCLNTASASIQVRKNIRDAVNTRLLAEFAVCKLGQIALPDDLDHAGLIECIDITDYTGPEISSGTYDLENVQLDVNVYALHPENEAKVQRRKVRQDDNNEAAPVRTLALPNAALHKEWDSLVFDDALPSRLLRYLVRMVTLTSRADLNLSTFNWNRLCLLHGPPGSGKSTLCRALAQKLSIRLGDVFAQSIFVEINTNSMLSKYFGESGKLIGATFEKIFEMAHDKSTLVCVIMDEVETVAGSRAKATSGSECSDGLRATNQLLTALDRLRAHPNVIVLCTSNLIGAIDPAFLDRVDIKQLIPSPSPAAIYNIFRSCLNELVRSSLVDAAAEQISPRSLAPTTPTPAAARPSQTTPRTTRSTRSKGPATSPAQPAASLSTSSPGPFLSISTSTIPTLAETITHYIATPTSPGSRVLDLAQKCQGFSGRTLRRLPILGLAMYTWGGEVRLEDAVSALEKAVEQEVLVVGRGNGRPGEEGGDVVMGGE